MNIFTFNKDKIHTYAVRELIKRLKIIITVFVSFYIFMFLFTHSYGLHGFIMPPITAIFLFILIVIVLIIYSQISEIADLIKYEFDDIGVYQYVNKKDLNLFLQLGMARNEALYNYKHNQRILYKDIDTTIINNHEIQIQSRNYDAFNNNGLIKIPKEVEGYDMIIKNIHENASVYRLIQ